jgi:hypothetical protein
MPTGKKWYKSLFVDIIQEQYLEAVSKATTSPQLFGQGTPPY